MPLSTRPRSEASTSNLLRVSSYHVHVACHTPCYSRFSRSLYHRLLYNCRNPAARRGGVDMRLNKNPVVPLSNHLERLLGCNDSALHLEMLGALASNPSSHSLSLLSARLAAGAHSRTTCRWVHHCWSWSGGSCDGWICCQRIHWCIRRGPAHRVAGCVT